MRQGCEWYKRTPRPMIDAKRVAKMTPLQACIYDLAIDLIYEGAGETPNDPLYFSVHFDGVSEADAAGAIADLCKMPGKLVMVGPNLTQHRAQSEAKTKQSLSGSRSKAGATGGKRSGETRRNQRLAREAEAKREAKRSRGDKIRGEVEDISDPKGSDAAGVTKPVQGQLIEFPPKAPTASKIAFDVALPLLLRQGVKEPVGRAFLAKLGAQYGWEPVAESATQAVTKADVGDFRSWLVAACKARTRGTATPGKKEAAFTGMW